MDPKIGDMTLGLSGQVMAVLSVLSTGYLSSLFPGDNSLFYPDGGYKLNIRTEAWYNGTEKGIWLCCWHDDYIQGEYYILNVIIAEFSSSDDLYVIHWQSGKQVNPPTPDKIAKEHWDSKLVAPYLDIKTVVNHVCKVIQSHVQTVLAIHPVIES